MEIIEERIAEIKAYLLALQHKICTDIELIDGYQCFNTDQWIRKAGGGGITRVLEKGKVFAKAGVNFSHIHGKELPPSASQQRPELAGKSFQALGLSLVIHPDNPFVPTSHANVRFFITEDQHPLWWFGGGFDLTPYYGFVEDCKHWHMTARDACLPFGEQLYPRFKQACDEYFYLKHRREPRGIGGLFFDDFNELGFETSFALTKSIGDHFIPAYLPIVEKRKELPFSPAEKAFQLYRRGRYVEFNLIYDRGTLFGLQSGGRTESILISLPPEVHWQYQHSPQEGSREQRLYTDFLVPKNWLEA